MCFPIEPWINTKIPPCDPPHFKFAKIALLKEINLEFSISSIFANDQTTSVYCNILMNLFAVIISLTVLPLTDPLTMLVASTISGLACVDTQFSHPP